MSIKEKSIQGEKEQQEEEEEEDPLEYEEWDGKSPFWIHCAAGSIAGVAEHVSVYPLDTVKTHIQCATCPRRQQQQQRPAAFKNTAPMNMWTTIRHIVSQPSSTTATIMEANATTTTTTTPLSAFLSGSGGYARLFRGVQTVLVGCIPAHALYFSFYEAVKHSWNTSSSSSSSSSSFSNSVGMAVAGAAAVLGHDVVMTPLDTIKQRLQLGHYNNGMGQAAREMILREGGILALYRSFPVTLLTNVPYGAIMVSTNEWAKQQLLQQQQQPQSQPHPSVGVCLMASSFAGMVASFLTTPLDRIKTVLQIQELQPVCLQQKGKNTKLLCTAIPSNTKPLDWNQAWTKIVREEGYWGLWRGCVPRMLSHTPAVAISWTTYEYCKQWLLLHQQQQQ